MSNEEIEDRVDALFEEANRLSDAFRKRSCAKIAGEAKRLAKRHRLLFPYLHACFTISNSLIQTYDFQEAFDNALEMIALLESEERARAFQADYDEDRYAYFTYWYTAPAYDFIGTCTAHKNGYNSPLVHGAVEDGINVSRRTGKLENIDNFLEYATQIAMAAGDYDLAYNYSHRCVVDYTPQGGHDRRWVSQDEIGMIYLQRGMFTAAVAALQMALEFAETYHTPKDALIESSVKLSMALALAGLESDFKIQSEPNCYIINGVEYERDEYLETYIQIFRKETVDEIIAGKYASTSAKLAEMERYCISKDALSLWFDLRRERIAARILRDRAVKNGADSDECKIEGPSLGALCEELRAKAVPANQWSAINALNAMLQENFPVSPLGISFPPDSGPFALKDSAQDGFGAHVPLEERNITVVKIKSEAEDENLNPEQLEENSSEIYTEYEKILPELYERKSKKLEANITEQEFDEEEYANWMNSLFRKSMEETLPRTGSALEAMIVIHTVAQIDFEPIFSGPVGPEKTWNDAERFMKKFPENARLLTACALLGMNLLDFAIEKRMNLETLRIPSESFIAELAEKAFDIRPDRYSIAFTVGSIMHRFGREKEAQRYLSRACQLARSEDSAVFLLGSIYKEKERFQDAFVLYDMYFRAGGRNPRIFYVAIELACKCRNYRETILYANAMKDVIGEELPLAILYWTMFAGFKLGEFREALVLLDKFDNALETLTLTQYLLRAVILAELGEESWKTILENGLEEKTYVDLLENAGELFERLWFFVAKIPLEEPLRKKFIEAMFARGTVPRFYFRYGELWERVFSMSPDLQENLFDIMLSDEEIPEEYFEQAFPDSPPRDTLNVYDVLLKQPLDSEIPAFDGWYEIRSDVPFYWVEWRIIARTEEEAIEIASEAQSNCYPIPTESPVYNLLGMIEDDVPRILDIGNRFHPDAITISE